MKKIGNEPVSRSQTCARRNDKISGPSSRARSPWLQSNQRGISNAQAAPAAVSAQYLRADTNYDYLVVGAGLFGAIFAHEAEKAGKRCLVIDKRNHIGGNVYTAETIGINVHKYGCHIFHTSNKDVWDYMNSLAEFNRFTNMPVARYKDELYNLPFNMNTFHSLWV